MIPPPPPPPPRGQASSQSKLHSTPSPSLTPQQHEPYGEIPTTSTGVSHRNVRGNRPSVGSPSFAYGGGSKSTYVLTPSSYGKPTSQHQRVSSTTNGGPRLYQYNAESLFAMCTTLASILWWHESPVIIEIFLFVALILYGLDLVDARDTLAVAVWIAAVLLTMACGIGTLLLVDDEDASGVSMLVYLLQLGVDGMFFCTMACWFTLQFRWLHKDLASLAINMERALHSLIPPISASILTYNSSRLLLDSWGADKVATLSPLLFALLMAIGMTFFGCRASSFETDENKTIPFHAIKTSAARIHSMLLLLVPGAMHILTFHRRIFSRYAASDELNDLILAWTVPYLLHCCVLLLHEKSPYEMPNGLFPKPGQTTLQGTLVPMAATVLASIGAQQRYLIPVCSWVSYQFNGHSVASSWVISMLLTLSTFIALFGLWIWGRKSTTTDELLFGEYHEDIVQLCICASGLLMGKAFGMPWNLTPLPILAFLGLSVWLTTRMLRYLSIFLFVIHASGVVLFTYRFASIDLSIPLVVPGIQLGLVRFGMVEVMASILFGLVVGFAVRPSGGVGADILKRVDVAGIILIFYSILLTILETTLLRRPEPNEFVGQETSLGTEDNGFLYDHVSALMTSALAAVVSTVLQRAKVISKKSWIVAVSIALGKAVAVVIDANEHDGKVRSEAKHEAIARRLFYRAIVASMLFVTMMMPRVVLRPIFIRSSARYKRSLSDGKPMASVPKQAYLIVLVYSLVILPIALICSISMVLTPLTMTVSSHYGAGVYYNMAPPFSEMFGFALTLWGISCLSMLNHYFPDGGAEKWKKISALALLMGAGIAFSAPTVPEWLGGDTGFGVSNPYASISSIGSRLVKQGKSRTGGWGILSACLATLLAITGPLELRERRHPSGRKDKQVLLRLMIFSLLFGSGVSWFITIQCMNQASSVVLGVTALCCMIISFFGTVTCVLGYFLELESFDEVDQMVKVWFGAFCVFGVIANVPYLLSSSGFHPFSAGGWLSAYLSVNCCIALALCLVLRLRSTKDQNSRGLGNLSCISAYLFATLLLYGRFGVAGVDHALDITAIFGVPVPVFGTLLVSPVLLLLEGESSPDRRSRVSRISGTSSKAPRRAVGITLANLTVSNRFIPVVVGSVLVFFVASLYTVLLRGSFLFGSAVAKSHEDVLSAIPDTLAKMAEKSTSQSKRLVMSARLAGASLWTSNGIVGPAIHLCGIIAAIPSNFLLVSGTWSGINISKAQVTLALPLNAIPLFFCKGTPTLRAAALIGFIGGIVQLFDMNKRGHQSQMRM